MQALFIGQTYIDVTFITDHMPTGDEKHVASAYAVSFGGNAVTAAFCCAELLCEQMDLTPEKMIDYLKSRGCRVGGVTMGEKGLLWYDEIGKVHTLPALPIPLARVIDTNGAGDVFHGAYIFSYLCNPGKTWHDHFEFARAASTYKIQRLGNEAGLPTLADIEAVRQEFEVRV